MRFRFYRLIQAVFLFPKFLQNNHDKLMKSFEGKIDLDDINEEFEDYPNPEVVETKKGK